jgi:hypothetical protein
MKRESTQTRRFTLPIRRSPHGEEEAEEKSQDEGTSQDGEKGRDEEEEVRAEGRQ